MQITTILLKIVRNHVRNQNQTKGLATHSPERSIEVKVVFLDKALQNSADRSSENLLKVSKNEALPEDRKGSSGDEIKSTMSTSAPSTKQNLEITSNQNNANHNNPAQNRPKSFAQPK